MPFTRRTFLTVPALLSFGPRVLVAQQQASPVPADQVLPRPNVIRSADGLLDVTLRTMSKVVDVRATRPVTTYTYNGIVPGETWEASPGDTMQINLENQLPIAGPEAHYHDLTRPHEWTNTNLHTHGLHVSPLGNSDNVFLDLAPGESFQHEISIPTNHTGGHFWYHPHRHGAVAHQVRAGMAGSILVRGEIDEVEEVSMAKEQMMVLQAIELSNDYELMDPIPFPTAQESFYPRDQILYTVNGVMNPVIHMYSGEVQRWRMLNAAEGKYMSLSLQDHNMHVIA